MNTNDTGVFQLEDKNWGYRYTVRVNGKRKDIKKTRGENGLPMTTKQQAIKARQAAIIQEQENQKHPPIVRKTVAELYQE